MPSKSVYHCIEHNLNIYGIKNLNRHHFMFHEPGSEEIKETLTPSPVPTQIQPAKKQFEAPKIIEAELAVSPHHRGGYKFKGPTKFLCPVDKMGMWNPQMMNFHNEKYHAGNPVQAILNPAWVAKRAISTKTMTATPDITPAGLSSTRKLLLETMLPGREYVLSTFMKTIGRSSTSIRDHLQALENEGIITHRATRTGNSMVPTYFWSLKEAPVELKPSQEAGPSIIDPPTKQFQQSPSQASNTQVPPLQPKTRRIGHVPCPYCDHIPFMSTSVLKVHVMSRHTDKIPDFFKLPAPIKFG